MKVKHITLAAIMLSMVFSLLIFSGCQSDDENVIPTEPVSNSQADYDEGEDSTDDISTDQEEATYIDYNALETIDGGYNCEGIYSDSGKIDDKRYLHLEIINDYEDTHSPYLTIYDMEAGNPAVEGKIVFLDDRTIRIKVDQDLYEELPSDDWALINDTYLEMDYQMAQMGIDLANNNIHASFWFEEIDIDAVGDDISY